MVSFRRVVLASCLLAAAGLPRVSAYSADDWTPSGAGLTGYTDAAPVWSDEFEGSALDRTKWDPKDIAWPDNGEQQYYTPDAVTVSAGELHITASHTPDALVDSRGGRLYTSGRIDTTKSVQFKHGLFAARIKMTYSQGLWPAWWMFGTGPKYSEFDIAELVGGTVGKGSADDASYGALSHFSIKDLPTNEVTHGNGASFHARDGEKFADDYYTMWMEWTPTVVTMGMDELSQVIYNDVSKIEAFDSYMYLILNVAVGGYFPGDVDNTTVMPQSLDVSWVRVWNKNGEDIMRVQEVAEEHTSSSSSTGSSSNAGQGSTSTGSGSSSDSGSTSGTTTPGTTTPGTTTTGTTTPGTTTPDTTPLGGGGSTTTGSSATSTGSGAVNGGGSNNAGGTLTDNSGAAAGLPLVSVGAIVALVAAALFGQ